ncbi:MAG: AcrR family transcriptional regulator [Luteibaculaceae bacterium]|jgi:AcrR family transcriptional regulator
MEIAEGVSDLFLNYGFKSVNMDDIARHLGKSKRTIYQFFKDKKEVVEAVVSYSLEQDIKNVKSIQDKGLDAISENVEFTDYVFEKLKGIHPSIFFDLEKYYPKSWKMFLDFREGFVVECIKLNIDKGQKEGVYRKEIKGQIIGSLYMGLMDQMFNYEVRGNDALPLTVVYKELTRYHLTGLANEKGYQQIQSLIEKDTL